VYAIGGTVAALLLSVFSSLGVAQKNSGAAAPTPSATAGQLPMRLNALAVRTVEPAGASPVTITIQRWSTDAEADQVLNAIREVGAKKLRETIVKLGTVGRIAGSGSVGSDLKFARMEMGTSGRQHITLAADRFISFYEMAESPRTTEYPFTVIDLQLDSTGVGSGTVLVATKISMDRVNKVLVFENYEDQPVKLQNVKRQEK
jgi:hypothetical protein